MPQVMRDVIDPFAAMKTQKYPLRKIAFALVSCVWAQFVRTLRQYLH